MAMERLDVSVIHEGICFSEPVYFDDGKNMFLPAGKQAKPFHVAALEQWKIPFLLTEGHEIDPKDAVVSAMNITEMIDISSFNEVDIEDLGSVEDLENLDEV